MSIVFLDRSTFASTVAFDASGLGAHAWRDYPHTAVDLVAERVRDAEVVVTNKVRLSAALIGQSPRLKLIAAAATGVDHIDLEAARRHGVAVCNVRGYAIHSVPEHVFAMLFALRRNIARYDHSVRVGEWSRSETFCLLAYPIEDLAGAVLGVIGAGVLGQAVARLGSAFGMTVLLAEQRAAVAVRPGRVPFDDVLTRADVISLHLPLSPQTRNLIGATELMRMKPGAILINTARGGVVDETALLAALNDGRLGGACLDVLSEEPPPAGHPLMRADLPNLLVTPHVAWASRQAQQRLADEVVENIAAYFRGERRNRVV